MDTQTQPHPRILVIARAVQNIKRRQQADKALQDEIYGTPCADAAINEDELDLGERVGDK